MKPLLGIDVDGVLADFVAYALDRINREFGTSFTKDDWTGFFPKDWMPSHLGERGDALLHQLCDEVGWSRNLDVLPGVLQACHALAEVFDLFAITHVSDAELDHRNDWVMQHGFPLVGAGAVPGALKGEVARSMGMVAVVEDNLLNAENISDCGVPCFLINRPWNANRPVPAGVQRVDSLWEVVAALISPQSEEPTLAV